MAELNSTQTHPTPEQQASGPTSQAKVEVIEVEEFHQPAEDPRDVRARMSKAGEWIESNARVAQATANEWLCRAKIVSKYAFEEASEKLQDTIEQTSKQIRHAANKDPIRFIAIVAGSAFVLGSSLRIWRSARYE